MPLFTDPSAFADLASRLPPRAPGVPRGVFLVSPSDFRLAGQSAQDNAYMQMQQPVDSARACLQHQRFAEQLSRRGIPTQVFPGDASTPDAVFPNNVFATAPGRLIVGAMKHAVRRREAERMDIRRWFAAVLRYACIDLSQQSLVAELTGCLVIDRARGIGFCGLTERCTLAGARAMHDAFGLSATLVFDLAAGEYHTNVVMSALAGRGVLVCPDGIATRGVMEALRKIYGEAVVEIDTVEKNRFVGNCIALGDNDLWLSAVAMAAIHGSTSRRLKALGFDLCSAELDELEKAGGSLRCMVGEIY